MLVAQITPAAEHSKQINPFSSEKISCQYMFAMAGPFPLGANIVNFRIVFGTGQVVNGSLSSFENVFISDATMTSQELGTWGTDDSVALNLIAQKIGASVVNTYSYPDSLG